MIKYVCDVCGSDNIKFDAWAIWNVDKQKMELDNVFDEVYCDDCENNSVRRIDTDEILC